MSGACTSWAPASPGARSARSKDRRSCRAVREAYATLGPILESIAARVDEDPCCAWLGPDGAGHFVKMVHNGIEYADMQFISEAYDLLSAAELTAGECAEIFRDWNEGDLESFLVEITAQVFGHTDAETGRPLVELIRDEAEQKGTGRWTVQVALELGVPVSTIAAAVFARSTSGDTEVRAAAREALIGPVRKVPRGSELVDDVQAALWCSRVVGYAQGLQQIRAASKEYDSGRRRRDRRPDLARRVHHPRRVARPDRRRVCNATP